MTADTLVDHYQVQYQPDIEKLLALAPALDHAYAAASERGGNRDPGGLVRSSTYFAKRGAMLNRNVGLAYLNRRRGSTFENSGNAVMHLRTACESLAAQADSRRNLVECEGDLVEALLRADDDEPRKYLSEAHEVAEKLTVDARGLQNDAQDTERQAEKAHIALIRTEIRAEEMGLDPLSVGNDALVSAMRQTAGMCGDRCPETAYWLARFLDLRPPAGGNRDDQEVLRLFETAQSSPDLGRAARIRAGIVRLRMAVASDQSLNSSARSEPTQISNTRPLNVFPAGLQMNAVRADGHQGSGRN